MKLIHIFSIVFILLSTQAFSQRKLLRYELKTKSQSCTDILEIEPVQKIAYWKKTCGTKAGEITMDIGISKFVQSGGLYTFAVTPISQFLMATIKDYKQNEEKEPSIVFLDINKDTVQIDSLVVFKIEKEKIVNYRGLKTMKKGNSYIFDLDKLSSRTHFTIPLLHSLFQEDVVFEIPLEGKNILVVQFNFPKYFCPKPGTSLITYNGINGQYNMVSDSLLVNKKTKEVLRKIP